MFENIDPKTLPENVFSLIGDRWMLVTSRHAGALQHHDRQLGRPGRSLEQAHGHDLRSPPAVYVPVFGGRATGLLSFFSPGGASSWPTAAR